MDKYQSHKVVEAFKIDDVESRSTLSGHQYVLIGADGHGEIVDGQWVSKHLPDGALARTMIDGYFVKYPDGYTSWSPAEAFEKEYTKVVD